MFGLPDIMDTDQGSQFTSFAETDRLCRTGTRISPLGSILRMRLPGDGRMNRAGSLTTSLSSGSDGA